MLIYTRQPKFRGFFWWEKPGAETKNCVECKQIFLLEGILCNTGFHKLPGLPQKQFNKNKFWQCSLKACTGMLKGARSQNINVGEVKGFCDNIRFT